MDARTLRNARLSRGLTLADLSRTTRLSPAIIAALEAGRFSELPAGIYARTFLRTYAAAVGLDPAAVLAAFDPLLPAARLDLLELAELRQPSRMNAARRHMLAALIDGAILCTLDVAITAVCSCVCGVAPMSLVIAAPGSMALLCATPGVLYFWLLGATDVRTAGPWLLDVEVLPPASGPLHLPHLLRRGGAYLLSEIQLAVAWRPRRVPAR